METSIRERTLTPLNNYCKTKKNWRKEYDI